MPTHSSGDIAVWKAADRAVVTAHVPALEQLMREHPQLGRERPPRAATPNGLAPDYDAGDARAIIVRSHHFENWKALAAHLDALTRSSSPVARFEAAVDAVVSGDAAALDRLLREHPDLARARSPRTHQSTLLHYVGANGVEYFRQRTPDNAVEIARTLLDAGAEVDAEAGMYGGATTLGLVATSVHPERAGVQRALIDLLLARGAAIDRPASAGNQHGLVHGCLANGRGNAAEYVAGLGARLELDEAAGVGRLDVVKTFFNDDGSLKANATHTQMRDGFEWACGYGRTDVVDYLLDRGLDVGARLRGHGQTGLHSAAYEGHLDTIHALLRRGAPLDVTDDTWRTTPLIWALTRWYQEAPERHYDVIATLVAAGSSVKPEWLEEEKVRADARMLRALRPART